MAYTKSCLAFVFCCTLLFLVKESEGRHPKAPVIIEFPHNITAKLGSEVLITCSATSNVNVNFQLLKFNNNTSEDITVVHKPAKTERGVAGGVMLWRSVTYTFKQVTEKDYGLYVCLAGNLVGYDIKMFWIIPKAPSKE